MSRGSALLFAEPCDLSAQGGALVDQPALLRVHIVLAAPYLLD